MEAIYYSEMLIATYQNSRCHKPESRYRKAVMYVTAGRYYSANWPRDRKHAKTLTGYREYTGRLRTAYLLSTRHTRYQLVRCDPFSFGTLKECERQLLPATLLNVLNHKERERERQMGGRRENKVSGWRGG
jgi:hypothetical protein